MKKSNRQIEYYFYALLVVTVALGTRLLLLPLTGPGAPFILFSAAVLISSFYWGVGPGVLAAAVSTPLAAFLFVYQAHYSPLQAMAQITVFAIEIAVICYLADRFATARERAESSERAARLALQERQIFFALIENSSDLIAISDKNAKIIYLNPAGRQMTALPENRSITGMELLDLCSAGQRELVSREIVPSVLKQDYWHGNTYLMNQKTGSEVAVSSSSFLIRQQGSKEVLGIGTVARDISEIQRTQEALRRTASELKEAQRVAQVGNWTWNLKTGRHEWSEELYRIFGKDPNHPLPAYDEMLTLFTPESARKLDEVVARVIENGSSYKMDLELAGGNEGHRWISSCGEAIRAESGEVVGIRGTAQDITELKELQRMREEWTSVIAHDLRQPISLISMSAELLPTLHKGEMDSGERVVEERIHTAAMSLSRMVDDLMDISRMEASRLVLERKWIDPRVVVRETLSRMSHEVSGFTVSLDESGELLPVYADQMRVEQVVSNLITNAVKYGKKDSKISVRLQRLPEEIQISVTNEGPGISKEEIPIIFSRFWRSKSTRGSGVPGLGLGLYIAKGLVEGHGGRIWVNSTPGKTTSFSFTLPTRAVAEKQSA
ncbi:MAG: ATP-binding protein [Bdellovibrionia bacterium]